MPWRLQTWGIQSMKHQSKIHNKKKIEPEIPPQAKGRKYLQLAMPGMVLTARDTAQDTRLAQEPEGSNKAENRQTGGRPQNSGEVFGGADGRSVLYMLVDVIA